jgi:L-alanine-DL-glutamate epimerase-like enolase superfamily enzyme
VRAPGVTAPSIGPAELARRLAGLVVRVDTVTVDAGAAPLADYPGGARPTSTVRIGGVAAAGETVGCGENVSFLPSEHAAFATLAAALAPALTAAGAVSVAAALDIVSEAGPPPARRRGPFGPYARAALEAALVDLGMRQAGLGLQAFAGMRTGSLRVVRSLAAGPGLDPGRQIGQLRATGYTGGLKLDVDPGWSRATRQALAGETGIAILDFKGRGDDDLVRDLADRFPPGVLFEDPPTAAARRTVSRDAPIEDLTAAARAVERGECLNLKAPRMGGPLAVLQALALAGARGATDDRAPVAVYLGGMWEVGAGRRQARQLAALFCPDAPNDLAPHSPRAPEELAGVLPIALDAIGFGSAPSRSTTGSRL